MRTIGGIQAKPIPIDWHSGLSIYASEPFLRAVGDEYGWLGGFNCAGHLRCVLPFTIIRKAFFRMVRFRVETIPWDGDLGIEEERAFLASAVEHFRATGADMILPATTNSIFRTWPEGAVAAPYGSYVVDLSLPDETLWNNLHSKHRNVVRNARNKGVKVRAGAEYLEPAYRLVAATLQRSKLGFSSYTAFQRLVNGLGENVKILIAEYQGSVQGCAVIPYSTYSAYYLYGGTIPNPLTGATNLLQWEAMRLFRGLGVKRYDFVGVRINPEKGSKQEGLLMFKQRFGGALVRGCLWKYGYHPVKYFLYNLAVRWRRGGDIVDQERHKLTDGSWQAHHGSDDRYGLARTCEWSQAGRRLSNDA
jgi:hypothetical protein